LTWPFCAAGRHSDAFGVCAREMEDPQLAMLVARLLGGGDGALVLDLVRDQLLPSALAAGDAWAAALLHWSIGDRKAAIQAMLEAPWAAAPVGGDGPVASDPVSALDLLRHCAQEVPAVQLWTGPRSLRDLHALAVAAAHRLDVYGLPVLALEALEVASVAATAAVGTRGEGSAGPATALADIAAGAMRRRLAAAASARWLLTQRVADGGCRPWEVADRALLSRRAAAVAEALWEARIEVDSERFV
jgi:RAVE protein 1 C terminal